MEEINEERPTYYSVIPSSVRYDENLKANEKILYSEISVLCNKNGYCYAANEYFANLYHVDKNTISRWINNLKKRGYIGTKIIYKSDQKTIDRRIIYLSEVVLREIAETYCQNHQKSIDKIIETYLQKSIEGIDKKVTDNNTSINNIYTPYNPPKEKDSDDTYKEYFNRFWKAYPKKENKKKTENWFKRNKPNGNLMKIILDKLELFKKTEQWKKNNHQFVPMPTTWLNGKRWEDEINLEEIEKETSDNDGYEVF